MIEKLPTRKRIRIKDYDYSNENIYFITICTKDRLEMLGKTRNEEEYYKIKKYIQYNIINWHNDRYF